MPTSLAQDPQLRELFFQSADEHFQELNTALLSLEKDPSSKESIEVIFRHSHSLKSESLSMGYSKVSEACHRLEDMFALIRDEQKSFTREGFDGLFKILDFLQEAILTLKKDGPEPDNSEIMALMQKMENEYVIDQAKAVKESTKEETAASRLKLDSVRVSIRILDRLMNIMEELIIERMKFTETVKKRNYEFLPEIEKKFDLLITELQYYITQSRLTPIDDVFQNLPRVIRDLTTKLNKKVDVVLELGNLKVDRYIAESIYEPVLHIIRNALDHGIESVEERQKLQKPANGKLTIRAYSDRGLAIIEIGDDGRGIDTEAIKHKISEKKHIDAGSIRDSEVMNYLFEGGISTAKAVTDLSGRGVGMNVVKDVISKVNGTVRVDTKPNVGTTMIMEFPFTLAIIKAMLIEVGNETYALPVSNIQTSLEMPAEEIQKMADVQTILWQKEEIPLLSLDELFNKTDKSPRQMYEIIIVKAGNEKLGLIVDRILQLEEIIVKPLTMKSEDNYFSGVTILGNNKTVLIIDVPMILHNIGN